MFKTLALAAIAASLFVGCAAPRGPIVRMKPAEGFDVEYAGSVGDSGIKFEAPEYDTGKQEGPMVAIEARILKLSAEAALELTADGPVPVPPSAARVGALNLSEAEARHLIQSAKRLGFGLISSPRLSMFDGQRGTITIADQTAYVSGFEIKGVGTARVADPVIQQIASGWTLGVKPTLGKDGDVNVEVKMLMSEAVRPIPERSVRLFGGSIRIQTPTMFNQQLKAAGTISKGRVVALTGLCGVEGEVIVVLLTGREVKADPEPPKEK